MNITDVYRSIEEVVGNQYERDVHKLLDRDPEMSNEELHNLRGRAHSTRDILRTLRNNLGYDHESL